MIFHTERTEAVTATHIMCAAPLVSTTSATVAEVVELTQRSKYRYFVAGTTCAAIPDTALPTVLDKKHLDAIAKASGLKAGVMMDEMPASRTWDGHSWRDISSSLAPHLSSDGPTIAAVCADLKRRLDCQVSEYEKDVKHAEEIRSALAVIPTTLTAHMASLKDALYRHERKLGVQRACLAEIKQHIGALEKEPQLKEPVLCMVRSTSVRHTGECGAIRYSYMLHRLWSPLAHGCVDVVTEPSSTCGSTTTFDATPVIYPTL